MKTKKTTLKILILSFLVSVLSLTNFANANHGSRNSLIGTWLLEADTGFPDAQVVTALVSFHRGGTLTVSQNGIHENSEFFDPVCGCNGGNGHGVWKRIGHNKYEFKFTFFLFSGPQTANFPINFTEPVVGSGQHIGYALIKNAKVVVNRDEFAGNNIGVGLNLAGENINPAFGPFKQFFKR